MKPKMLVIMNIDVQEVPSVDGVYAQIYEYQRAEHMMECPPPLEYDPQLMREVIHGRRYRNSHGLDVVVGIRSVAAEAIGLALEDVQRLDKCLKDNAKLRRQVISSSENATQLRAELVNAERVVDEFLQLPFYKQVWELWKKRGGDSMK